MAAKLPPHSEPRARYKGVLFDLWGTLTLSGSRSARSPQLFELARALGADPSKFEQDWSESLPARCRGELGPLEETVRAIAARQGVTPAEPVVRRAVELRLNHTRSTLEAGAQILPDLDALRAGGARLAVVSDTTDETPRVWPSTPLGARFDVAVFSCAMGFCKPDPRIYRQAVERLGLTPAECAFVGDGGSHELTGAKSVGLDAFLFRFPGQPIEPEYRYEPEIDWRGNRLNSLSELLVK